MDDSPVTDTIPSSDTALRAVDYVDNPAPHVDNFELAFAAPLVDGRRRRIASLRCRRPLPMSSSFLG
jgi:hypothetical protein